jgi:hypothetical protein
MTPSSIILRVGMGLGALLAAPPCGRHPTWIGCSRPLTDQLRGAMRAFLIRVFRGRLATMIDSRASSTS